MRDRLGYRWSLRRRVAVITRARPPSSSIVPIQAEGPTLEPVRGSGVLVVDFGAIAEVGVVLPALAVVGGIDVLVVGVVAAGST